MKKPQKIAAVLSLLLAVSVLYSVTEIQYFTAKNENDAILLEWKTGLEDNLNRFEVERSASSPNNFIQVGNITAIGSNSYYYFRDEVAMSPQPPVYYYRLKLVDNNGGHVYSQTITVTHVISSVRDTWIWRPCVLPNNNRNSRHIQRSGYLGKHQIHLQVKRLSAYCACKQFFSTR